MPTYDYRCEKGHTFEVFHSIKDESPRTCPECGSQAKRVPGGGGGLLFKGSGFYITDYRSDSYKKGAKGEAGGGAGGEKPSGPGEKSSGSSEKSGGSPSGPAPSGGSGPKQD